MNDIKAQEIFLACMGEMYSACTPPASWDVLAKEYMNSPIAFCDKHFITKELYVSIRNKYAKRLDVYYKRKLDWFLIMYAPTLIEGDLQ